MANSYQTIIVGAGAGGLVVGKYLKNALILDKKAEIGKPVRSGEGISSQALERMDINPDPAWISSTLNSVQRIMPNGKVFGSIRKNLGYILDKSLFEKFLASQCQAEIQLNTEILGIGRKNELWEIKTKDGRIFTSKFLIGADGFNSIVRQIVFKENLEVLPAIQYLVELERNIKEGTAKIYLDNEKFFLGYAWIFPKSKNTANIGILGKGNLVEIFNEFLEKVVKKEYGNFKLLENRSGVVPFGGSRIKLFKENALLVGDAAGLADPIFLGGINQAMISGKIAARCILENKTDLYEKRVKSMPFSDPKLMEARNIFYSFDNQVLNELGEVLEGKGTSYLKSFSGIVKFLSKPNLRKKLFEIRQFFSIWWQKRDYLW